MRSDLIPLPDVRSEVIARYIFSSPGIHRPTDLAEREAFISAYQWQFKGWLPADRSARWLDLGCGQGQLMSLALRNAFREVLGVDLSAEMLSACEALGLNVRATTRLIRCVNLLRARTKLYRLDFLEHLPQSEALALLRESRRLLGPAGVMFIKVPNGASPAVGDMFCSDLTHESLCTSSSIARLATLAGFSRCDVREVGPVPHGIRSVVRYALWQCVRAWYRLLNAIEAGSPGAAVDSGTAPRALRLIYWERYPERYRRHARGSAIGRSYRLALGGAKIALGLECSANRDQHTMRTFEIPACGALCAQRTEQHQEIFREGTEAVFFDDPDELKSQVTRYLSSDDARARIAAAGFDAVTQGAHTYADRIVEMVALARPMPAGRPASVPEVGVSHP